MKRLRSLTSDGPPAVVACWSGGAVVCSSAAVPLQFRCALLFQEESKGSHRNEKQH